MTTRGAWWRVATFLGRRAITRGNRGVIVLTVVLMGVIFAQLLFIPSLIQGATNQIQLELRQYVTANIEITPSGTDLTIPDPASLLNRARRTPGVAAATATVLAGSQVRYANRIASWSVFGVDPGSFARTFDTARTMIEGGYLDPGVNDEILLGVGIAGAGRKEEATYLSSLKAVHVGDTVAVTLLGGQVHDFRVKGIYDTYLSDANLTAYITSDTAIALLSLLAGKASAVYLRTSAVGGEASIIERIRPVEPKLHYDAWQSLSSTVKDLTGSFDLIKSIMNGASLLVAAVTVFIVTYVDLVNRRRTIGIERAIGITSLAITLTYEIKAVVFALLGIIIGFGIFFGLAVPIVRGHPFHFPIGPVSLSVTGTELERDAVILLVVAVIGALVPAWRAVRVRLLEAIWGQ